LKPGRGAGSAGTTVGESETVSDFVRSSLARKSRKSPDVRSGACNRPMVDADAFADERERLIDLRIEDKITEQQFGERDAKHASELRELEALLPEPEPVIDPEIMASAIARWFAEFPYLSMEEQHALAHRTFVAFDVNEDGGADKAVMRGEALAELYATNGRRSRATK
jgi:hypothetical protein